MLRKGFNTFGALLLTGAMLTACSSEDATVSQPPTPPAVTTYFLTVDAAKGDNAGYKRALSLDGTTLNASWATTEKVYVKDGVTWLGGSLTPSANAVRAMLNGAITGFTGSFPCDLTLQFPRQTVDYTGQIGTLADIAAKYDYATTTAHVDKIDGSNITATSSVTFENQQAVVKFILKNKADNSDINATSLGIIAGGLKQTDSETGYLTITPTTATNVIYAALSGVYDREVTLTAVAGGKTYVFRQPSVTFENGEYISVTVNMSEAAVVTLSAVTASHLGWVIGADGNVYPTLSAAQASTTAVAMIAYVSGTGNSLALALADESSMMTQADATNADTSHPAVTGGTWKLATVAEWTNMENANTDLTSLNAKLSAVGNNLKADRYWTPDNYEEDGTCVNFSGGSVISDTQSSGSEQNVRACLSF